MTDPLEIVERGYDAMAESCLAWSEAEGWAARPKYLGYLLGQLADGASVLELGCGAGVPVTKALAERYSVTAVDVSRRQLELARANAPTATFVHADMAEVDLPQASFDAVCAVCAFYSLTHVPRERHEELVRRIASWLIPGGVFVGSFGQTDNPAETDESWLGVPMFFSHFDADTSVALVQRAGFEIVSRELVPQIEHGVEGAFLWLVARCA